MKCINRVMLLGFIGNAPEMRTFNNGAKMATFSLATNLVYTDKTTGDKREQTEWSRCVAYHGVAEVIGKYARKGSKVYLEGRMRTRKWAHPKTKQMHQTTEVVIEDISLLDSLNMQSRLLPEETPSQFELINQAWEEDENLLPNEDDIPMTEEKLPF